MIHVRRVTQAQGNHQGHGTGARLQAYTLGLSPRKGTRRAMVEEAGSKGTRALSVRRDIWSRSGLPKNVQDFPEARSWKRAEGTGEGKRRGLAHRVTGDVEEKYHAPPVKRSGFAMGCRLRQGSSPNDRGRRPASGSRVSSVAHGVQDCSEHASTGVHPSWTPTAHHEAARGRRLRRLAQC